MTDLATSIEQTHAAAIANQPPAPDPIRIDLTQTRRNAKVGTVFHAWWEDSDMWDGWAMYDNLQDALQGAASDYVGEEYGHQDDPEERYDGILEWHFKYGSWRLTDEGTDTGVQVTETAVYAARTGQEA